MNMRNRIVFGLSLLLSILVVSCDGKDEETYPPILTEYADLITDSSGRLSRLVLDDSTTYIVANTVDGYHPDVLYRVVCGYVPQGNKATLYQLTGVHLLADSTDVDRRDAVKVVSAWRTPRYLNFQFSTLTQGGSHYWGFAVDSIRPGHAYLHLHHDQHSDPLSYSSTEYASLPLSLIGSPFHRGDSITLCVNTFSGNQTLEFF